MMSEAASELWFSPTGFETNKILIASNTCANSGGEADSHLELRPDSRTQSGLTAKRPR